MEPQLCQLDSDNLNVEWPVAVEVVWGTVLDPSDSESTVAVRFSARGNNAY